LIQKESAKVDKKVAANCKHEKTKKGETNKGEGAEGKKDYEGCLVGS